MKESNKIICWWSGGITSAVACKVSIELYGKENCRVIFIDTCNEHYDTYRFFLDCEQWYGIEIEIITGIKDYKCRLKGYNKIFNERAIYYQPNKNTHYYSIRDVWEYYNSLNVSYGAICSSELKRKVREKWQKENEYKHQVFGFEFDKKEFNRALGMHLNHQESKPIFPLLMLGYDKVKCLEIVESESIKIPMAYEEGLSNNNCLGEELGCVQGGIGYWQKLHRDHPELYKKRGELEHQLTDKAGHQVTMCKEQSNEAKEKPIKERLLFLLPHPDYPNNKTVLDIEAREPEPLKECNGFCGTNDLTERSITEKEINYGQIEMQL